MTQELDEGIIRINTDNTLRIILKDDFDRGFIQGMIAAADIAEQESRSWSEFPLAKMGAEEVAYRLWKVVGDLHDNTTNAYSVVANNRTGEKTTEWVDLTQIYRSEH